MSNVTDATDPGAFPYRAGVLAHREHTSSIYALASLPGTHEVISSGGDGLVLAWDTSRPGEVRAIARIPNAVYALYAHPSGDLLITGTSNGELHVIDLNAKQERQRIKAHDKGIFHITALNDHRLACAGGDGTLSVWRLVADLHGDVPHLVLERSIPLSDAKLRSMDAAPGGGSLAVACGDGSIRVLDTELFNDAANFHAHDEGVTAVAHHPGKPVLMSGGKDGFIRVWHTGEDHRLILEFAAHRSAIYQIAVDEKQRFIATAGRDKMVKLWDGSTFEPRQRSDHHVGGHSHSVNALIWSGNDLYSGGDDRRLVRWTPVDAPESQ